MVMRTAARTVGAVLAGVLVTAGCIGCMGIRIESPSGEVRRWSRAEFGDHTRAVFVSQNRLSAAVIDLLDQDTTAATTLDTIQQAEADMFAACRALNAMAARRSVGATSSLRQRRQIVGQIAGCEVATVNLQRLLDAVPDPAGDWPER